MKIAGIIAEYNPFHNGHLYQIQKIRESHEDIAIIVVLSSSFTQRGIPGICDQHLRAQMALSCGADVVFELPIYYSTGSAEYFASGAVALLDKLGSIDYLYFGSESGDISELSGFASSLLNPSEEENKKIMLYQSQGQNYAKSRSLALNLSDDINNPNNILGIEYIKSLILRSSSIIPVTIKREGAAYLDDNVSINGLSSAMAIRNALSSFSKEKTSDILKNNLPKPVYDLILNDQLFLPVFINDFSDYLLYQLYSKQDEGYSDFYDVGEALSNVFRNHLKNYKSFEEFILECKTKNLTYTRINRALTHIMLNLKESFMQELKARDYILYARLLGFNNENKKGTEVLSKIKHNTSIPIITRLSTAKGELDSFAVSSLNQDIFASNIYQSIVAKKYGHTFKSEYSRKMLTK